MPVSVLALCEAESIVSSYVGRRVSWMSLYPGQDTPETKLVMRIAQAITEHAISQNEDLQKRCAELEVLLQRPEPTANMPTDPRAQLDRVVLKLGVMMERELATDKPDLDTLRDITAIVRSLM